MNTKIARVKAYSKSKLRSYYCPKCNSPYIHRPITTIRYIKQRSKGLDWVLVHKNDGVCLDCNHTFRWSKRITKRNLNIYHHNDETKEIPQC